MARPVLFETEDTDYPYWGRGSSVLVEMTGSCFWVTARHVLCNQGAGIPELRIFPADDSRQTIPFKTDVVITDGGELDEVFKDLRIVEVDVHTFRATTDSKMHLVNLNKGCIDPRDINAKDPMFAIGFPSEARFVDYEQFKISYDRHVLPGTFAGQGDFDHCYRMHFKPGQLQDLDGMSGGPVFHGMPNETPRLAGILIQGTVASRSATFIGVHVLHSAIKKAVAMPTPAKRDLVR